jgi:hypothetical protein
MECERDWVLTSAPDSHWTSHVSASRCYSYGFGAALRAAEQGLDRGFHGTGDRWAGAARASVCVYAASGPGVCEGSPNGSAGAR